MAIMSVAGLYTSATPSSTLGVYAITLGSLAASSNYAVDFTPGSLTISPLTTQVTTIEMGRTNSIEVPGMTSHHYPVGMMVNRITKSFRHAV